MVLKKDKVSPTQAGWPEKWRRVIGREAIEKKSIAFSANKKQGSLLSVIWGGDLDSGVRENLNT